MEEDEPVIAQGEIRDVGKARRTDGSAARSSGVAQR